MDARSINRLDALKKHWEQRNKNHINWWQSLWHLGFNEDEERKIVEQEKRKSAITPRPAVPGSGADGGGFFASLVPSAQAGTVPVAGNDNGDLAARHRRAMERMRRSFYTGSPAERAEKLRDARGIDRIPENLSKKLTLTNPHIRELMSFFMRRGYSTAAATGIVANLAQESNADPRDPRGLAHWTVGRRNALIQRFGGRTPDKIPLLDQAAYIDEELQDKEHRGVYKKLRAAQSSGQAAEIFGAGYEIPHLNSINRNADVLGRAMAAENFSQANRVQIEILHKNVPDGTKLRVNTQGKAARVTGVRQEKAMSPVNSTIGN